MGAAVLLLATIPIFFVKDEAVDSEDETPLSVLAFARKAPILLFAVAMFAAGCVGYVTQAGWEPLASFLNTQAFARFASYDLSVIPLFILMGNFATQGGLSRALFEVAASAMARGWSPAGSKGARTSKGGIGGR